MLEFIKYLFITDIGRICLSAFILIIGAIIVNEYEKNTLFYIGLIMFALQFAWMFINMIYQVVIKDWLGL